MKSTRCRFCFVALRTNLKDIKPTEKNYILKPNELRNHSPVSRWIDLCRYFSLCVHKDKACLSVLETRFISSRCMKLKLTQRVFSKLKRFQCSIKLEQRFYPVFKPRTRYQNTLLFTRRKIFPFHSITFALLQLFMYKLFQMFFLV